MRATPPEKCPTTIKEMLTEMLMQSMLVENISKSSLVSTNGFRKGSTKLDSSFN